MKREKQLETIIVLVTFFVVLKMYLHQDAFLIIAILLGVTGILSKYLTEKIDWLWRKFSLLIGSVTSKFILTIIYYLVLCPAAFVARIRGKITLQLKNNKKSFWEERNKEYKREDLENVW